LGDGIPLRAVTQWGIVADDEPYLAEEIVHMGARGAIQPWRRAVDFLPVRPVPIHELADRLELTRDRNWGYSLRFGLVPLTPADFMLMKEAMTG